MGIETDAMRAALLAQDGVTATFGSSSFTVILEKPEVVVNDIVTEKVRALARTSDLSDASVVEDSGTPLIVGGVSYTVRTMLSDGEGLTRLWLEDGS